eukprot:3839577-Alexandrium_andersonii.AAC.1
MPGRQLRQCTTAPAQSTSRTPASKVDRTHSKIDVMVGTRVPFPATLRSAASHEPRNKFGPHGH